MKYTIAFALLVVTATMCRTQTVVPLLNELDFMRVAANYNTYDDQRKPMTFLAGFELTSEVSLDENNAVEVLFNPFPGVGLRDCSLLRWDPVMRVWKKFTGNQVRMVKDGTTMYWSAQVRDVGVYALMKELNLPGATMLSVPNGYKAEHWRYVQSNMGVVCEGFKTDQVITVPLPSVSPMADISLQLRKNGEPLMQVSNVKLGTLAKGMWKDAAALNPIYTLILATN